MRTGIGAVLNAVFRNGENSVWVWTGIVSGNGRDVSENGVYLSRHAYEAWRKNRQDEDTWTGVLQDGLTIRRNVSGFWGVEAVNSVGGTIMQVSIYIRVVKVQENNGIFLNRPSVFRRNDGVSNSDKNGEDNASHWQHYSIWWGRAYTKEDKLLIK